MIMINKINFYTRDYELFMSKMKKIASTLYANKHIFQKTNRSLFKVNMKRQKEKIIKKSIVRYFIVFERVLTSAQTKSMRKKTLHKKEMMKKKKKKLRLRNR